MKKSFDNNNIAKVLQYNDTLITDKKEVYRIIDNTYCEKSGKQYRNIEILNEAVIISRKGKNFAIKEYKEWTLNG